MFNSSQAVDGIRVKSLEKLWFIENRIYVEWSSINRCWIWICVTDWHNQFSFSWNHWNLSTNALIFVRTFDYITFWWVASIIFGSVFFPPDITFARMRYEPKSMGGYTQMGLNIRKIAYGWWLNAAVRFKYSKFRTNVLISLRWLIASLHLFFVRCHVDIHIVCWADANSSLASTSISIVIPNRSCDIFTFPAKCFIFQIVPVNFTLLRFEITSKMQIFINSSCENVYWDLRPCTGLNRTKHPKWSCLLLSLSLIENSKRNML